MNHPAKAGRVRVFKKHSTSTRLPRKEAAVREQLYRAVASADFFRLHEKKMFAGLSGRGTV